MGRGDKMVVKYNPYGVLLGLHAANSGVGTYLVLSLRNRPIGSCDHLGPLGRICWPVKYSFGARKIRGVTSL